MFTAHALFSGFSVNDLAAAKDFYSQKLNLEVEDQVGGTAIKLPDGNRAWMYPKPDHQPAAYTTLNFVVDDIDQAMQQLTDNGVTFEHYDVPYQEASGIMRGKSANMGPNIAWFKDPAGNILAIVET